MTAYLNALGVVCALGHDKHEVARNLFAGDCSGMRSEAGWVGERSLPVGAVTGELVAIPEELRCQRSRNNQLLMEAALQIRHDIDQAIQTYGRERIGIVLGTSTSGIDEASQGLARYVREQQFPADYDYQQQELGAPANFLADWLQLSGPAYVISTACTSSARALMSAAPARPGHLRRGAVRRCRHPVQADPQRLLGTRSGVRATLQSVFGEPQRHQYRRSSRAVPDEQTAW
jgi:3-oxoacyl-[acyl-carrier-protein] synthase-1